LSNSPEVLVAGAPMPALAAPRMIGTMRPVPAPAQIARQERRERYVRLSSITTLPDGS
jgi:hypothetical protein